MPLTLPLGSGRGLGGSEPVGDRSGMGDGGVAGGLSAISARDLGRMRLFERLQLSSGLRERGSKICWKRRLPRAAW